MKFTIKNIFLFFILPVLLILFIKIIIADTGLKYAVQYLNTKFSDEFRSNQAEVGLLNYVEENDINLTNKKNVLGWKKNFSNYNYNYNLISQEDLTESLKWTRSHGGNYSNKFSNFEKINIDNVSNLALLWKYDSSKKFFFKKKWNYNVETNPIYFDGLVYVVTPHNEVLAINVLNGELIWKFKSLKEINSRGITFWKNNQDEKKSCIFVPIRESIFCINYKTGKRVKSFGIDGYINTSIVRAAPVIWRNNLIVATLNPPELKLYSLPDGNLKWITPLHPNNRNFSGGTPWGGISLDNDRNLVFLTTGNPRPALYGGNRPGDNKNANSIIAIDLINKKIKWSFQEVAHDLWDYDLASPPILASIKINNIFVDVVVVASKIGNTFILKRDDGTPFFDIGYRLAPKSKVIGESTSKYQIFRTLPEPLIKFNFEKNDLNKKDFNYNNDIYDEVENSNSGWFEPPSINKPLILYGLHGGAQWTGGVINPYSQNFFVPVNQIPWRIRLFYKSKEKYPDEMNQQFKLYKKNCSSCHGLNREGKYKTLDEKEIEYIPSLIGLFNKKNYNLNEFIKKISKKHDKKFDKAKLDEIFSLFDLWDKNIFKMNSQTINYQWSQFLDKQDHPATKPPWGKIVSLNLITGKINWQVPHGYINNENIGTSTFGGLINTKGKLIFATGTEDKKIIALNENSGKELWSFEMDAAGSAPPTTFEYDGKQILIVVSTGGRYHNYENKAGSIYAFAIKN